MPLRAMVEGGRRGLWSVCRVSPTFPAADGQRLRYYAARRDSDAPEPEPDAPWFMLDMSRRFCCIPVLPVPIQTSLSPS